MGRYILEVEGERYLVETRRDGRTYHMSAMVAMPDEGGNESGDEITSDEGEALEQMIRLLKVAPPRP